MSRKHFAVVRHFLENDEWDYFQFVEIGLDRIQHGFWSHHDPEHVLHEPGSPYRGGDPRLLPLPRRRDRQRSSTCSTTTPSSWSSPTTAPGGSTAASASTSGWSARACSSSTSYPEEVTPFAKLDVDWDKTTGLERGGILRPRLPQREGPRARGRDRAGRLRAVPRRAQGPARGDRPTPRAGRSGTLVFKPEEVYRDGPERRPRPDRPLRRPGLAVGRRRRLPDAPRPGERHRPGRLQPRPARGLHPRRAERAGPRESGGAHLLDIAPTLLELGGYDVPPSMRDRTPFSGLASRAASEPATRRRARRSSASGSAASATSAEPGSPMAPGGLAGRGGHAATEPAQFFAEPIHIRAGLRGLGDVD